MCAHASPAPEQSFIGHYTLHDYLWSHSKPLSYDQMMQVGGGEGEGSFPCRGVGPLPEPPGGKGRELQATRTACARSPY